MSDSGNNDDTSVPPQPSVATVNGGPQLPVVIDAAFMERFEEMAQRLEIHERAIKLGQYALIGYSPKTASTPISIAHEFLREVLQVPEVMLNSGGVISVNFAGIDKRSSLPVYKMKLNTITEEKAYSASTGHNNRLYMYNQEPDNKPKYDVVFKKDLTKDQLAVQKVCRNVCDAVRERFKNDPSVHVHLSPHNNKILVGDISKGDKHENYKDVAKQYGIPLDVQPTPRPRAPKRKNDVISGGTQDGGSSSKQPRPT